MKYARICIVRLSALGDIINSALVLQFIHKQHPEARIDWITESQFAPILQPHSDLEHVYGVPLKRLKREKSIALLRETVKMLRNAGPYDMVIDLQGLLKSAIVARLAGRTVHGFDAASAREGIASIFYTTRSRIPYEENIIRRNCDLVAGALNLQISDDAIRLKAPALPIGTRPDFLEMPRYVAIIVGASWPSKCYPPERFAQVCSALPLPCLLIWGSDAEKTAAESIASGSENARVAPLLSLEQLRDVIGHAELTLGGDTGPTHLAWALNRPSVVLFGPTTPRMMFETEHNVAIESDSKVDIMHIDKNDMSIATIPPETVVNKALELL